MSGGRFRGRYKHRRALGIPIPTTWRFNRRIAYHNEVYHSNTVAGNGSNSNVVTLHVTFNTPMQFIPPGNNYGHEVGPYIWCSNTTHTNAFQVTYHGVGNGTTCIQFTHNSFNANTGTIGGPGGIKLSNAAHVTINTIDLWGNQWLFLPLNQDMPGTLSGSSTIPDGGLGNEAGIRSTGEATNINTNIRVKTKGRRRGGRRAGPNWKARQTNVVNVNPTTSSWTIYYANTVGGLGPNVAFTPSGRKVIHEWSPNDDTLADMSDMEVWWNFPQSEPHGFIWVANGVGQPGSSNALSDVTPDANNSQMYIYLCNSSFNPTTNSSGIESCGDAVSVRSNTYLQEFSNTTGGWVTYTKGQPGGGYANTYGLRYIQPVNTSGWIRGASHALLGANLPDFNANTYQFFTVRMKVNGPPGSTKFQRTMGPGYQWSGRLSWYVDGSPYNTSLISYYGNQWASLGRHGTTPSPNDPGQTTGAQYIVDSIWRPLEFDRPAIGRRRGGRRGGRNWQGYVDFTWDLRTAAGWAGPNSNNIITDIRVSTIAQTANMDYTIDKIEIWGINSEQNGGGYLGPNNCSWTGVGPETLNGKWSQAAYTWTSNGIFGAPGANSDITPALTANTNTGANTFLADSDLNIELGQILYDQ